MNREEIQRHIYLRAGTIQWESFLERRVEGPELQRILTMVSDHIHDESIDWPSLWKDFDEWTRVRIAEARQQQC